MKLTYLEVPFATVLASDNSSPFDMLEMYLISKHLKMKTTHIILL